MAVDLDRWQEAARADKPGPEFSFMSMDPAMALHVPYVFIPLPLSLTKTCCNSKNMVQDHEPAGFLGSKVRAGKAGTVVAEQLEFQQAEPVQSKQHSR